MRITPSPTGITLQIANAGHPPALVTRRNGVVEPVDAEGLLLGVFADVAPESVHVDLGPGDGVVLYTDGVIEQRGSTIDDGQRWLEEVLAVHAGSPVETLIETLERSLLGERSRVEDDIAIMALRVATA